MLDSVLYKCLSSLTPNRHPDADLKFGIFIITVEYLLNKVKHLSEIDKYY